MSMFVCQCCDQYRDADDGCEEIAGALICAECAQQYHDEIEEWAGAYDGEPVNLYGEEANG